MHADSIEAVNKKLENNNKAAQNIAKEMGIAYGGFIKQVEKSNEQKREEIRLMNRANLSLQEQKKSAGDTAIEMLKIGDIIKKNTTIQDSFNRVASDVDLGSIRDFEGIQSRIVELSKESAKLSDEGKKELELLKHIKKEIQDDNRLANEDIEESILRQVDKGGLLAEVLKNQGVDLSNSRDIMQAINNIQKDGKLTMDMIAISDKASVDTKNEALKISNSIIDSERELARISEIQSNKMRDQITLQEKMIGLLENNANTVRTGIISAMRDYDQSISDAGRDFGFVLDNTAGTAIQMASLNMEAARFGMSTKDTLQMMGDLGEELATIDQKHLASSVKHFVAIEKATGASSKEITTIAGEMMRAGKSAEDVENYFDKANRTAKMLGVNTKKVFQGVARNIDKMRQMGFQGGEESLTKMVATADRLRMNVDEIFDVAKKARTIEGAMDMAAELQLAGGSFANIDPMSLLAAARKGPKELQKILTQMGGDIGRFNDSGEFEFDAIDADRMQMVADATGQSVDSLSKMIQKNAEDNKKVDFLGLSSSIGDDERNFLSDMTKMKKDGTGIEMSDELSKLAKGAGISLDGVDSLADLNQDQIQQLMEAKEADISNLENQAEQNQSFMESIEALKSSIMNIFTLFEPFIKILTSVVQFFNGSTFGKLVFALGALAFVVGPRLIGSFGKFREGVSALSNSFKGMKDGKGVVGKIKGAFSGAKPDASGLKGEGSKDMAPKGKKGGGGMQDLAKGLAKMGGKGVLKGIGNLALAVPVLAVMLAAIPTLLAMGVVGLIGKQVEFGFRSVARGVSAMGNAKGLLKGALAMVVVGASLIPFAFALTMMADVSWKSVGVAFVMLLGAIVSLIAVGALLSTPLGAFLLVGALMLVAVGVALVAFSTSLLIFSQASAAMQGMEFSWLGDLGWNLLKAAPGLLLGGIALAVATPGLLVGSIGLMAISLAAKAMSSVDWNAFSQIGPALSSIVPGLLGFSLAGLMFVNPVTLLGMLLMISNLSVLTSIMVPLSKNLNTGADGLDRFADGLSKLQAAANSLDLSKLESLKGLSTSMAVAGSGGSMIGEQIDKIAEAITKLSNSKGGEGKGGGTQKIQVDLKLNGRDLQSIIVDDTQIVS